MSRIPKWALLAALLLAAGRAWADPVVIKVGGTGGALTAVKALAAAYARDHPEVAVDVLRSQGSLGGIRALKAGVIDLAVSAAPLSAEDRAAGLKAIPWGRTPFVIAVANETPVSAITTTELADIYAGRRTAWADGSRARPIVRPRKDTDNRLLAELGPEMAASVPIALERAGAAVAITDQDAADAIGTVPGAVGSLGLCQIVAEERPLRPLALDGVEPSIANLAAGRYHHFKEFHLVVREPAKQAVSDFVAALKARKFSGLLEGMGILQVGP